MVFTTAPESEDRVSDSEGRAVCLWGMEEFSAPHLRVPGEWRRGLLGVEGLRASPQIVTVESPGE